MSYILKQTYSFQIQIRSSTYDLLLPPVIKGLSDSQTPNQRRQREASLRFRSFFQSNYQTITQPIISLKTTGTRTLSLRVEISCMEPTTDLKKNIGDLIEESILA